MSWLSSLTSAIFGGTSAAASDESQATLLVIEGALFLDRPDAIRGVHECLFTDATLAIRRTDTPFTYHLVVTRTIDEDDAVSAADSDASDLDNDDLLLGNEKIFIVSPSMKFHTGLMMPDNLATLRWCEVDGAPDEIYEFVVPGGTSSPMFQMMRQTVLQCIYQRVYMRSAEGASPADLESLVYVPEGEKQKRVNKGKAKAAVDNDKTPVRPTASATAQQQARQQPTTPTPKSKSTPTQQQQTPTRRARTPSPTPPPPSTNLAKLLPKPVPFPGGNAANMDLTLELDAELFMFLAELDQFQLVTDKCTVQLLTNASDSTDAWLAVESDRGVLIRQPLTQNMNHMFWPDQCAMIWNMYFKDVGTGKDGCVSVSVNLATDAEFREWRRAFTQLHVQATLEASLASMQLDDKDMEYLEQQTSTDRGMGRDDDDDDDDEERRRSSDEESEDEDEEVDDNDGPVGHSGDDDDDDHEHDQASDDDDPTATNSLLTTTRSRTYVVRGGSIGVFGYGPRGKVKFETMIKKVKFNRDPLKPTKVLLHDGERKMILSDATKDATKLYELDLGSEKVVREFSLPGRPVNDLSAAAKSTESAAGAEATFLGVSDRSVFRVDPRMAGSVVSDDSQYTYSKNVGLQAVASSSSGQVAVASAKGELRLFNQVGKRATTALQSAGDAIVHLDVSVDGNYVLATTRSHLLLFDVRHTTAKGAATTAFSTRMPKDGRPSAARLALRPEHVAKMGMAPRFTAAYFNVSVTGESSLVTSTGPYVITWSLDDVIKGRKDKYVIKRYDEDVVADQFRFGDDQQIVLALPNDVQSVSRRRMGRL
ncbi:VID27 cytoplasmic protein-domain-containing protein [Catenaria anguillulae PL171]|uniref:VID27 cytoplasmic protein-domain-containing protein n=1 Tax=Catenaria anguillulae PL171 TaxID=765915 RepID=A0A1Y2HS71_9FUNG|nr:VID27 cytoplasmic protein-domain-containing protein [Catenaria anguillulae PL171]